MNSFQPTLFFGFNVEKKAALHQMWVDQYGNTEWRPVPMIELTDKRITRSPAIVGTFSEDDDGTDD